MTLLTERRYPDPAVDVESRPFWDATATGVLLLKRCRSCGATHFYPRSICPHCFSADTEWHPSTGQGAIYAYSVARRVEVPYVVAYVTLTEGVTILTNIVECNPDELQIGQRVKVTFRKTEGGMALPVFKPDARTHAAESA